MEKKHYKVRDLMQQRFPDWTLHGWLDLQDDLNAGWVIERVDILPGASGWAGVRNGALVYILSKTY